MSTSLCSQYAPFSEIANDSKISHHRGTGDFPVKSWSDGRLRVIMSQIKEYQILVFVTSFSTDFGCAIRDVV